MGVKKTRTGGNYLKVADGRFRLPSTEDDPEASKRTVNTDDGERTMYEKVYDEVDGFIKGIFVKDHDDYGTQYSVKVTDEEGETFNIQMNEESRYFESFAQIIPEINLDEPVLFKAYSMPIDGKTYRNVGLTLYQDVDGKWEKVPNHFKTYSEKTGKNKLKNGMEKFDFSKLETKKAKKKMKLDLLDFLSDNLKPIMEELKEKYEEEEEKDKKKDKKKVKEEKPADKKKKKKKAKK